MRLIVLVANVLVSTTALGQAVPPIEGDAALLRVLRDAQSTNAARFERGVLRATAEERTRELITRAEARVTWDGPRTYWNCSLSRTVAEPGPEMGRLSEEPRQVDMIETPENYIWYSREDTLLQMVPDRSRTYDRTMRMRPEQTWFVFEPHDGTRWSELLDPAFVADHVEKLVLRQDGDNVVLERVYDFGSVMTVVGSLTQGGNIVRYHCDAPADARPGTFSLERRGTYEWEQDDRGEWRLSTMQYSQFPPGQEDDPSYSYRLTVHEFDPDPVIARDRFELASLKVAPGTKVQEFGPRHRTYRLGAEEKRVGEEVLDTLAGKMRERGFAVPAE